MEDTGFATRTTGKHMVVCFFCPQCKSLKQRRHRIGWDMKHPFEISESTVVIHEPTHCSAIRGEKIAPVTLRNSV